MLCNMAKMCYHMRCFRRKAASSVTAVSEAGAGVPCDCGGLGVGFTVCDANADDAHKESGMFDALLGNAGEVDVTDIQAEVTPLLIEGEKALKAYKVIRDLFIFTNKRLILIDKQGISGKKAEYHSIPYRAITHFAVETAGTFDRDSEVKIWMSGGHHITKEIKKGLDLTDLQRILATYVL